MGFETSKSRDRKKQNRKNNKAVPMGFETIC